MTVSLLSCKVSPVGACIKKVRSQMKLNNSCVLERTGTFLSNVVEFGKTWIKEAVHTITPNITKAAELRYFRFISILVCQIVIGCHLLHFRTSFDDSPAVKVSVESLTCILRYNTPLNKFSECS